MLEICMLDVNGRILCAYDSRLAFLFLLKSSLVKVIFYLNRLNEYAFTLVEYHKTER